MISFKNYLAENAIHTFDADTFDMEQFEKDCAFFIRHAKREPMYHGSKRLSNLLGGKAGGIFPFVERNEPRDTPVEYHFTMNTFFNNNFHIKPRNWMFVTGQASFARGYGTVFRIFPIGKFEWISIVEKEAKDLYLVITDLASEVSKDAGYYGPPDDAPDEILDAVNSAIIDKLDEFTYRHNDDLSDSLLSPNEIMMKCDKFYAISDPTLINRIDTETFTSPRTQK